MTLFRRTLLIGLSVLFCSFSVAQAADNDADKEHVCKEEDLIGGTWKLLTLQETPPRKESLWFHKLPYQYLTFFQDHYFAFLSSPTEIATPAELQKMFAWPQTQKHSLRYTLDNKGILNLFSDRRPLYSYRCVAVNAAEGDYIKGDLVLTAYTRKSRSSVYKLYRRWY